MMFSGRTSPCVKTHSDVVHGNRLRRNSTYAQPPKLGMENWKSWNCEQSRISVVQMRVCRLVSLQPSPDAPPNATPSGHCCCLNLRKYLFSCSVIDFF